MTVRSPPLPRSKKKQTSPPSSPFLSVSREDPALHKHDQNEQQPSPVTTAVTAGPTPYFCVIQQHLQTRQRPVRILDQSPQPCRNQVKVSLAPRKVPSVPFADRYLKKMFKGADQGRSIMDVAQLYPRHSSRSSLLHSALKRCPSRDCPRRHSCHSQSHFSKFRIRFPKFFCSCQRRDSCTMRQGWARRARLRSCPFWGNESTSNAARKSTCFSIRGKFFDPGNLSEQPGLRVSYE